MAKRLYPIHLYIKSLPNIISLSMSVLLNIIVWFWLFWQIKPQEEPIFLHYNVLFGVDYVGPWWQIAFLPAAGIAILLVNLVLGWLLFGKDRFAAYLLNTTTAFAHIILLVSSYLLVNLNV